MYLLTLIATTPRGFTEAFPCREKVSCFSVRRYIGRSRAFPVQPAALMRPFMASGIALQPFRM